MKKNYYIVWMACTFLALSGAYFIDHSAGWLHWQITAPAILFIAGIFGISFRLSSGKVNDDNPNKFVQGMMLGTTLKFLVFIAAAALYLFIQRKNLHKPDLFYVMGVYLVFLIKETYFLYRVARQKPE
ncbi:MAG: hypothetical protein JNM44_12330 [Chitinophagaceae bacterium]|nr:hypothetical protein [Chitinophagaceae bacterium]